MWSNRDRSALAFGAAALGVALFVHARAAFGCAPCASGDPTLAAVGTEQPYAGRIRSAFSLGYRTETIGVPGVDLVSLTEYRADLSVGWAPLEELLLLVIVPVLDRRSTDVTLLEHRTRGLGDIELRGKLLLFRDRTFAPRHVFGAIGAVKLPSAPFQRDASGQALPTEAQTGTGALDAVAGLAYTATFRPWSAYFSADVRYPIATRVELQPGASLRGTGALQRELRDWLSLRAVVDGRWDGRTIEQAELVTDSGGVVLFAGPDAMYNPGLDITVLAGTRWPVLQAKNGNQSEGWTATVAIARDW